jgi:hypothetical protein
MPGLVFSVHQPLFPNQNPATPPDAKHMHHPEHTAYTRRHTLIAISIVSFSFACKVSIFSLNKQIFSLLSTKNEEHLLKTKIIKN